MTYQQKKKLFYDLKYYFWKESFLYKYWVYQIIRRCVPEKEMESIIRHRHALEVAGHFGGSKTATKILQSDFYYPSFFKKSFIFVNACDHCQRVENISRKHEMPLNNILVLELSDFREINFMSHFPFSNSNKYILVDIDYMSKWVETMALLTNDGRAVINFLRKNSVARFGTPRVIISDRHRYF